MKFLLSLLRLDGFQKASFAKVAKSDNTFSPFNGTGALVKPKLLLGCDCFWCFWNANSYPIPLPSGLHMVPTQLGNIFKGLISRPNRVFYCSEG